MKHRNRRRLGSGMESLETRNLFASDISMAVSADSSLVSAASITSSPLITAVAPLATSAAPITSIKSGEWSDAAIWAGGVVPTANDAVIVGLGTTVTMHDAQSVKSLDIAGSFTMTANLTSYGNMNVLEGGSLNVDSAFINFVVADDTIFIGGDSDAARADIGLWIEGDAKITGLAKTPYLDLVATGSFTNYKYGIQRANVITSQDGQTLVKLSATPLNWQAGDELAIGSPEGVILRTQLLQILTKADGVYAAIKPITTPIYALQANGQLVSPKITNLTRTAGVSAGDGHHKAHVMVLHDGELDAEYAEFRNLGPQGKLGRYPVHLHHTPHPSTIENSVIWSTDNPSNRAVAIHDTSDNIIRNNVIYNVFGHGVFMEDPKGNEIGNQVIGNITMAVSGGTVINDEGNLVGGEEVVTTPEKATYNKTAHYWVRPGNVVSGNTAISGTAVGMVVMPGKGGTTAAIDRFTAYGVGRYGIQAGVQVTWNNPIVVNADVSGYGSTQTWGLYDTGSTINNPFFILNGENPDAPFLNDTDRAYVAQIYLNQTRQLFVNGGFLVGKKAVHVHYSSAIQLTGTKINVDTLVTPTYYESDVLFTNSNITANFIADLGYSRRVSQQGRIVVSGGSTLNGKLTDKTYTSRNIQTDAGLTVLASVKDMFGRDVAVEVPNTTTQAGYVSLPSEVKFIRYQREGAAKPAWWPVYYSPVVQFTPNTPWKGFSTGVYAGSYIIEAFDIDLKPIGTYKATIEAGKVATVFKI